MPQQILNIGTNANDGTGDTLRDAMIKVNDNFTELYNSPLDQDGITLSGNQITAIRSNDDLILQPSGTGAVVLPAIRFRDNAIEGIRSNEDINILPSGTGQVVFGAIKISGTTFSSDDSSTININEALNVDGTATIEGAISIGGALSAGSGSTIGNLTLADGSITDCLLYTSPRPRD